MQYITDPVYNAYNYVWSYFYPEQEYECDVVKAQYSLKALIAEIYFQIEEKKKRINEQLKTTKSNFSQSIHSGDSYQEKLRLEYSRIITNLQNDLNIFNAIQIQIQKLKQNETQLITMRKDKEYIKSILPIIENLVFAASYEGSLSIKLGKFTDFLQLLWGKEYVLNPENNLVEQEFKDILTKIPGEKDIEQSCVDFSIEYNIIPSSVYRCCDEEKSKIYQDEILKEQSKIYSSQSIDQNSQNVQTN